jgi:hypothetical protein
MLFERDKITAAVLCPQQGEAALVCISLNLICFIKLVAPAPRIKRDVEASRIWMTMSLQRPGKAFEPVLRWMFHLYWTPAETPKACGCELRKYLKAGRRL